METHHPHLNHQSAKKFSHYFYEFLMLFLAVSLGFIVENIREKYIESHRAEEFSIALLNDLKNDTAAISSTQHELVIFHLKLDTLIYILKSPSLKSIPSRKLYQLNIFAYGEPGISPNTVTATEMKNSGSVRYFKSDSLKLLFSIYDLHWAELMEVQDKNDYIKQQIRLAMAKLFDIRAMNISSFFDSSLVRIFNLQNFSDSVSMLSFDPDLINQYANYCVLKQKNWENYYTRLIEIKLVEINLINELKKEYHLE